jgi:hypothetical protein
MFKALIDLFRTKQEEKQPEAPAQVVKEPAVVIEPIVEIKPTEPEPPILSEVIVPAPPPSQWSPVPDTAPNIVVDAPVEINIPTVEAAFIAEPIAVKDEVVVEVEKKPKRGRPKSGKPKPKKK